MAHQSNASSEAIWSNQYIIADGSTVIGFVVQTSSYKIQLKAQGDSGGSSTRTSSYSAPIYVYSDLNKWFLVTVTYDGTAGASTANANIHYNDAYTLNTGGGSIGGNIASNQAIEIGRRTNSGSGGSPSGYAGYYKGSLSNVAFWNKKLSSAEICEIYKGRDGGVGAGDLLRHSAVANLKGWWIADVAGDAYDGTIKDRSGNTKHMTPSGFAATEHYTGAP